MIFLLSRDGLGAGVRWGEAPSWSSLAFAVPLAMLAYTGLETVANLAAETRSPGKTLPRSLFAGIGAVVAVSVRDRGGRDVGLPAAARPRRARRLGNGARARVDPRPARRDRGGARRVSPGGGSRRRCACSSDWPAPLCSWRP